MNVSKIIKYFKNLFVIRKNNSLTTYFKNSLFSLTFCYFATYDIDNMLLINKLADYCRHRFLGPFILYCKLDEQINKL